MVAIVVVGGDVALRDAEAEVDGCGREDVDWKDGEISGEPVALDEPVALFGDADGIAPGPPGAEETGGGGCADVLGADILRQQSVL